MTAQSEKSLGNDATFAGRVKQPVSSRDVSIGDERTLGDGLSGQDTVSGDIEIVDLESRYTMEGTLGQGGMGAVLLATDTRLGRKVAIKRILGEAAGNRMAVQRFLTEAKSIAAINHPNIVQIYDYGQAKDGPFLIMEFVDGGSLLDRCRWSRPSISPASSATVSRRHTISASSTTTSSRRTSCSLRTASLNSRTSAWPRPRPASTNRR